jgi:SAM-dependent methyltransferase
MKLTTHPWVLLLGVIVLAAGACQSTPSQRTHWTKRESAQEVISITGNVLSPVYAPLAEQIVRDFDLTAREGLALDIGGGPGALIVELARRTRLYWVDVDINPNYLVPLAQRAEAAGVSDRVAFMAANVEALPFRDGCADVIVSRGSYHFWPDTRRGFAEIWRVLKPGGVAYIGRGFSRNLPPDVARAIRDKQGSRMKYDRQEQAALLRQIMNELNIRDYQLHMPDPPGVTNLNYGIWIEFHKPAAASAE